LSQQSRFVTEPGDLVRRGDGHARLTVRSLLKELGVEHATRTKQRAAVARWLKENQPDRVLSEGLEQRALLPRGMGEPVPTR
jgi:hypothetical protein